MSNDSLRLLSWRGCVFIYGGVYWHNLYLCLLLIDIIIASDCFSWVSIVACSLVICVDSVSRTLEPICLYLSSVLWKSDLDFYSIQSQTNHVILCASLVNKLSSCVLPLSNDLLLSSALGLWVHECNSKCDFSE